MIDHCIISFPNNDNPSYTFSECLQEAIKYKTSKIIIRHGTTILLHETIRLKENSLNIIIEAEEILGKSIEETTLHGNVYCLFQVCGRKTKLTIKNIKLHHSCYHENKTEIGACIFALHQSEVEICNCCLISDYGFAIWAVQRAKIRVIGNTVISSTSRSGCVCFGQSKVMITDSIVKDCKQHGICLRGRVDLTLHAVKFIDNGVRALYGYQNARILMNNCFITGTKCLNHAAVDIDISNSMTRKICKSLQHEEIIKYTFYIENCEIVNNNGIGLNICGDLNSRNYFISDDCKIQSIQFRNPDPNSESKEDLTDEINEIIQQGQENQIPPSIPEDTVRVVNPHPFSTGPDIVMDDDDEFVWEYSVDDPSTNEIGWHRYSRETCEKLENVYTEYERYQLLLSPNVSCQSDRLLEQALGIPNDCSAIKGDKEGYMQYLIPTQLHELDDEESLKTNVLHESASDKYRILVDNKYMVDIVRMEQHNIHTWYSRSVRRRRGRGAAMPCTSTSSDSTS